jgi:hypothetical protein
MRFNPKTAIWLILKSWINDCLTVLFLLDQFFRKMKPLHGIWSSTTTQIILNHQQTLPSNLGFK